MNTPEAPGIAIINYGMGNLLSVANAIMAVGGRPYIAQSPDALDDAALIILPGVGAFGDGMKNLRAGGWIAPLEHQVFGKRTPFLGICLGMQLLATTGLEHGRHDGLGWVSGTARRMASSDSSIRIPHIGWNDVQVARKGGLFTDGPDQQCFYFVHSYIIEPDDDSVVTSVCTHGEQFAATLERDNIQALQFHPEKSHCAGLTLLRNVVRRAESRA